MPDQSSIATLGDLKTQILRRADMEFSDFVSDEDGDSELVNLIQKSYRDLYRLIVGTYKDYYVGEPIEFSIPSGSSSYELDAEFYKLTGVDRSIGGGQYRKVRLFNFAERNVRNNTIDRAYFNRIRYRIVGNRLLFTPASEAFGDYRYWFVPKPIMPVEDDDTIDGINGWDEYIVVDCAIKCLNKEESDVSELVMRKRELKKEIEEDAMIRDESECETIQDVNSDYGGGYYDDGGFY